MRDEINEKLARYCSDQYGNGDVGAANILWLEKQGFEFIRIERVYRLGNLARFEGTVTDSAKLGVFLEALDGLEGYPLFSDDTLSELEEGWTDEAWKQFIAEHGLEEDVTYEVAYHNECYWENTGQADLYGMSPSFDVEEFVALVRTASQTWNAHYYSGMYHELELCGYCKDAGIDK